MVNGKLGSAVIGYGGMGGWHTEKHLGSMSDKIELVGIYDIDPERGKAAEEKGIHAFSSQEELLKDERIDFVVIATPNDFHHDIAIAAMKAGKHVISEKPVTLSVKLLDEIIEASRKYNRIFTVHQNRRWDPDYLTVKKVVSENKIGKPFRIESRVHGSRGIPGDWRGIKVHGGGMVYDWGIHVLDQALNFDESAKLVSVYAQKTNITNLEVDDGFFAELVFDNGLNYHCEVGTSNFIELPRWYVLCENGSAVIKDWDLNGEMVGVTSWDEKDAVPIIAGVGLTKTMAPRTDDTIKKLPLPYVENTGFTSSLNQFYNNFVAAVKGEEKQFVTHEQQRNLMKLVEAIFKSAETNEVIKL